MVISRGLVFRVPTRLVLLPFVSDARWPVWRQSCDNVASSLTFHPSSHGVVFVDSSWKEPASRGVSVKQVNHGRGNCKYYVKCNVTLYHAAYRYEMIKCCIGKWICESLRRVWNINDDHYWFLIQFVAQIMSSTDSVQSVQPELNIWLSRAGSI